MARKRDLDAQSQDLRRKLTQESADTVARLAEIRTELTAKIEDMAEAIGQHAERVDASLGTLLDLLVDDKRDTKRVLLDHEERIARLEARPPAA